MWVTQRVLGVDPSDLSKSPRHRREDRRCPRLCLVNRVPMEPGDQAQKSAVPRWFLEHDRYVRRVLEAPVTLR